MQRGEGDFQLRPLLDVTEGEVVQVADILFETIREACPALGIRPGEVLRGDGRTGRTVMLRRLDGERIEVDRFYAAFVGARDAAVPDASFGAAWCPLPDRPSTGSPVMSSDIVR